MNLSVMGSGLDPTLVIAREFDARGSAKVDKVAQEPLFGRGEQDLDV